MKMPLKKQSSIAHIFTERALQDKEDHISKKKVRNERLKQSTSGSSKAMFHNFGAAKDSDITD